MQIIWSIKSHAVWRLLQSFFTTGDCKDRCSSNSEFSRLFYLVGLFMIAEFIFLHVKLLYFLWVLINATLPILTPPPTPKYVEGGQKKGEIFSFRMFWFWRKWKAPVSNSGWLGKEVWYCLLLGTVAYSGWAPVCSSSVPGQLKLFHITAFRP